MVTQKNQYIFEHLRKGITQLIIPYFTESIEESIELSQ
jgi:hypothetical protein